jgi:putative zinc finger protein
MTDLRRPSDSDHPDDLLAGSVDGTLTDVERAELQAHLHGCEQCRSELLLAESAARALAGLPELDAPWGLGREAIEESRKGSARSHPRRWAAIAGAAAAAVLIVGLGVAVLRGPQNGAQPAAAPATSGATSSSEKGNDSGGAAGISAPTIQSGLIERRNRNYASRDVEDLASAWARRAKTRTAQPPQEATTAPTTAATSGPSFSGAATSAPTTAAGTSGTPAPTPSAAPLADLNDPDSIVSCIDTAAGMDDATRPIRVIVARFEEKPALIGIFLNGPGAGQPADLVVVWVSSRTCELLHYASHRIDR